jgi:hypothetical protein
VSADPPAPVPSPAGPDTRFGLVQLEVPWPLGPPDGRYLLRSGDGAVAGGATHVVVLATLGAAAPARRRRLRPGPRTREAAPDPEPAGAPVTRVTVIDTREPFPSEQRADQWLGGAGAADVSAALAVLNEVLRSHRAVAALPGEVVVEREDCTNVRIGYGAGGQVADGRWTRALELDPPPGDRARRRRLAPAHARLAAVLAGRERLLVCEQLILRARSDLDAGHPRAAALQLLVALDAAVAELGSAATEASPGERMADLRGRREGVAQAAQAALAGDPDPEQQELVADGVRAVEAALRARAAGA